MDGVVTTTPKVDGENMQIGFLGLGQMGLPMSRNVAMSFPVTGWDVRPEAVKAAGFATENGQNSPSDVARAADLTVLMVRDSAQAEQVLYHQDGYLDGAVEGRVLIIMSSLPPGLVSAAAHTLSERGVEVLDAPVSGGVEGAVAATLTIMAAGSPDVLSRCRPVLDTMGHRVVDVGKSPGLGQTVKAMNQLAYFSNMAVAAEALVVAAKAGIDPEVMVDVLSASSGDSWALRNRVPLAWRNDYISGGALSIARKDLKSATDLAADLDIPMFMAPATAQLVALSQTLWGQDGDDPLMVKTAERLADTWLAASIEGET